MWQLDDDERYAVSLALGHCNESSPDITGALGVATAMTMGFLHRARTGQGQYIESTMLASNLYLCSEDAIRYEGQVPLAELDGDIRGLGPLDRLYADGVRLAAGQLPHPGRVGAPVRRGGPP